MIGNTSLKLIKARAKSLEKDMDKTISHSEKLLDSVLSMYGDKMIDKNILDSVCKACVKTIESTKKDLEEMEKINKHIMELEEEINEF